MIDGSLVAICGQVLVRCGLSDLYVVSVTQELEDAAMHRALVLSFKILGAF